MQLFWPMIDLGSPSVLWILDHFSLYATTTPLICRRHPPKDVVNPAKNYWRNPSLFTTRPGHTVLNRPSLVQSPARSQRTSYDMGERIAYSFFSFNSRPQFPCEGRELKGKKQTRQDSKHGSIYPKIRGRLRRHSLGRGPSSIC